MNKLKHFLFSWLLIAALPFCAVAQQSGSFLHKTDTISLARQNDSIALSNSHLVKNKANELKGILKENIFLNSTSKSVSILQVPRKYVSKDVIFYILCSLLLMLGILRLTYSRYFSNLVRVFFNTSLRQSQLTDQLLQAKLPSMFFNLFFIIISGCYIFLLLNYFGRIKIADWEVLPACILGLLIIYLVKFFVLKFAGWLTGYNQEAETYIFIVFLINKIIALFLVPVVVVIAFSKEDLVYITLVISYIIIAAMLLMRFIRSYGLLQHRLKVSGFHFMLYIAGVELLPAFLIYKAAVFIISKNL